MARSRIEDFKRSRYMRLFGDGGARVMLSELERRLLVDVPVPQADDIDLIFSVPRHVEAGSNTRNTIAKELRYASRQGPYYADAAIALRLIQAERVPSQASELLATTDIGQEYISAPPDRQAQLRREIVLSAPIIKFIAATLGITVDGESVPYPPPLALLDEAQVARVLREKFNLARNTAQRRAHTLCGWLANL